MSLRGALPFPFGGLGRGHGDLGLHGGGGVVELLLGDPQGLRVVAHDGLGGLLDALTEAVEVAGGARGRLAGGGLHALVEKVAGHVEGLGLGVGGFLHALIHAVGHAPLANELLAHLLEVGGLGQREVADGLLELTRKTRLGGLGLLGQLGGSLDDVGEAFPVLAKAGGQVVARGRGLVGGGEAGGPFLRLLAALRRHVATKLFLVAGKVPGLGPELAGGII